MTNKNRQRGNGFEMRLVQRALKRRLRASRQPGSGVYRDHPNDVLIEGWLGECKMRTVHPSVAQMMEWLDYVQANAKRMGYEGAFLAYNHKGSRKPVVVLSLDDFLALLQTGLDKSAKM